jgi:hypothetical protein
MPRHRYLVRVTFREPSFEQHRDLEPRARVMETERWASSDAEAVDDALRTFRVIAMVSWVGWVRVVESATATKIDTEDA